MILSRAPVRITLGGGGTDLPSYYTKHEGFLIAGAINKYLIVGANQHFYDSISLKYSKMEMVNNLKDVEHNLIREALKYLGIDKRIELTSLADVPSGTGLGSSGAFLVALLNSLYKYKGGKMPTNRRLAEIACDIVINILKDNEGKQDQYICSLGGIKAFRFHTNGKVKVISLADEDIAIQELEKRLSVFFTGFTRRHTASEALKTQNIKTREKDECVLNFLHEVKEIGILTKQAIEQHDYDEVGHLMDRYWMIKKRNNPIKKSFIDKCYNHAKNLGALGGKVMGASSDVGFFLFYHPGNLQKQATFRKKMCETGLYEMDFSFDGKGVTTLFDGGG